MHPTLLSRLARWLREQARAGAVPTRAARWLGRSWAHVTYGIHVEPTWLELTQPEVAIAQLPAPFRGFRIVQLSDFHCGRRVSTAFLSEAVTLAQAQNPDLVVLTGDFIHHGYGYIDAVADTLSRLRAPHGVFAVLGNHDFSVRNALGWRRHRHLHSAVANALAARQIRVLRNESVTLERGQNALYLVGVEDLWSRVCDVERAFAGLQPDVPRIVLAHNPRTVERLKGRRCDLMLSGHTHGGQIHHPVLGRPTLGKRARRFAAGMYRYRQAQIYVNKGVGFGFPFRYGVRPEVAVLTLVDE